MRFISKQNITAGSNPPPAWIWYGYVFSPWDTRTAAALVVRLPCWQRRQGWSVRDGFEYVDREYQKVFVRTRLDGMRAVYSLQWIRNF